MHGTIIRIKNSFVGRLSSNDYIAFNRKKGAVVLKQYDSSLLLIAYCANFVVSPLS